ncbi:MAG: succinate dehydrogenase/fumarate reductase iron-sulfur subunit [Gloeomargaritaceae cyanobacterium C42_A2020_066]|nr:succinate dehydrogenase/fumarate reductase iron-sulfur subunit [Gloeomargaritaceae cyanobacterium C42_A2020_066]
MTTALMLHLHIWRQAGPETPGTWGRYTLHNLSPDLSFLEMLDLLNESLLAQGERPVEFDSDCREGICGTCSLVINGRPHGPQTGVTACQLYLRQFRSGDRITVEPFRARPFPVVRDLVVDRSALDRIMAQGGYVTVNVGSAPDANALPVGRDAAEQAMAMAECIGCGACIAACPNGSASLFVAAKVSQYTFLPQGQPEAKERVQQMVAQMDAEGFGACSNHGECADVCPKKIPLTTLARFRRSFFQSWV